MSIHYFIEHTLIQWVNATSMSTHCFNEYALFQWVYTSDHLQTVQLQSSKLLNLHKTNDLQLPGRFWTCPNASIWIQTYWPWYTVLTILKTIRMHQTILLRLYFLQKEFFCLLERWPGFLGQRPRTPRNASEAIPLIDEISKLSERAYSNTHASWNTNTNANVTSAPTVSIVTSWVFASALACALAFHWNLHCHCQRL